MKVFLPKTDFPMRGNLPKTEPELLKNWENIYENLRIQSKGREKFVLNFGPPYANGHLHIGHFLTEVLKDVVNKTFQMLGYDAPMVPGWDCHGLPIEWSVEENFRKKGIKKEDVDFVEFRKACRDYANHWIPIQKEELKRFGIIADFKNPYITMDYHVEGRIVEQLSSFLLNDLIYKDLRPVLWSVVEQTALAESEVEYKTIQSPSLYIGFPIQNDSLQNIASENNDLKDVMAVIWTTTPWTIPANRAISYNKDFDYIIISFDDKKCLIAENCLENFLKDVVKDQPHKIIKKLRGLKNLKAKHPIKGYDFDVPFLEGDHVTSDAGTGLVHTAPGHGLEDFYVSKKHGIAVPKVVDVNGYYYPNIPEFGGEHIFKVTDHVIDVLKNSGCLLASDKIEHNYPHSWRSKKPLIYLTTEQWFISINKIRSRALEAIDEINWLPETGRNRIHSMIENRPDWCISRQRCWGTPIPIFVHKETGEPLKNPEVQKRIADIIKKEGADAWYAHPNEVFLGPDYDPNDYDKVKDIVDVWFDSGCVCEYVVKDREELRFPSDLVLEGSDQHRGWFQSTLLQSIGFSGKIPYKNVVTHGFVLDEKGSKMSKSLGNVIAPQKVMEEYGADVLRLWVIDSDSSSDLRVGPTILKRTQDRYRRFRNTLRYLLGVLSDYNEEEKVEYNDLLELEKYILSKLTKLDALHKKCVKKFSFVEFYNELHNFCNIDLSSFYFDIRKDTLYCDPKDSVKRRATRTVMDILFKTLTPWLAPVLSFTAEEAYQCYQNRSNEQDGGAKISNDQYKSIHMQLFEKIEPVFENTQIEERWREIRRIRGLITSSLEVARANGLITSSLQARVDIYSLNELPIDRDLLNEITITGSVVLHKETPPEGFACEEEPSIGLKISKASGEKCVRCWKVGEDVETELCERCREVVKDAL